MVVKLAASLLLLLLGLTCVAHAAVTCQVTNAQTGDLVEGALCSLRSSDESILHGSASTNEQGLGVIPYSVTAGEYLLRVSQSNFYVSDQRFSVVTGPDASVQMSLSPVLNTTDVRAVLRWGTVPRDLDSWTFITSDSFSSECDRVGYSTFRKTCSGGGGSVHLDLDDTSSFGPETTTFSSLPAGTYAFWVYSYSGETFNSSNPPASVEVYTGSTGSGVFRTFHPPAGTQLSWHVFDIIVAPSASDPGCLTVSIQTVNVLTEEMSFTPGPASDSSIIGQQCNGGSSVCNTRVSGTWKTCGNFGDPHILTWNRTGVTCRAEGTSQLIDNEWFSLGMFNEQVDDTTGATATSSIRLIYKQCNPMTIEVTPTNFPEPINAPDAGVHSIRKVGNNLYLDAINTRIQIRESGDYLVFGISTPFWNGPGICNGCPGDELDTDNPIQSDTKRTALVDFATANSTCAQAGLSDFFLRACVFDLVTTGDQRYVSQATAAVATYSEVQQAFQVSQPPTGSASFISTSYMLVSIIMSILFLCWM